MPDTQAAPKIDPEFESLIPSLGEDEFNQLEENIIANGCNNPLTLWRGYIIDGHTRFRICSTHGIKYDTVSLRLPSREADLSEGLVHQYLQIKTSQA